MGTVPIGSGSDRARGRCRTAARLASIYLLVAATAAGGCREAFDREATMRRARNAIEAEKYGQAERLLDRVLERNPEDGDARFEMGRLLALSGRPMEARLELFRLVLDDSTRADALEHLGMLAFSEGDRQEAIEMLTRAVRMGARKVDLYDTISYLLFETGKIEEAKRWMERAIEARPGDPRYRLKLATLHNWVGHYEEAQKVLEPLVERYPGYHDAWFLLGKVHRQLGNNGEAMAALEKAASQEGNPDYDYELGMVKLRTGDLEGAVEAFSRVLRVKPEDPQAHYGLGQAYVKLGRRKEAKESLARFRDLKQNEKSMKSKRATFVSHWQEGVTSEIEGDYEAAYASFQEALEIKPGDLYTHVLLWLLERNRGDEAGQEEAFARLQRLLRAQGRELAPVCLKLGVELVDRGREAKAAEVLEEAVARDPDYTKARYYLVRLYARQGRMDKVRAHARALEEAVRHGGGTEAGPGEGATETAARKEGDRREFIGAAACAGCHRDKYDTFVETAHHLTSQVPTRETVPGDFGAGTRRVDTRNPDLWYELSAGEDGFYQKAVYRSNGKLLSRKERMDLVIGSGKLGQSYLYWKGERLYQLPISYLSATDEWINSPGYRDGEANFTRPIAPRCLECHSTYFETPSYRSNAYDTEEYVLGVGCERCHGAGSRHADYQMEPGAQGAPYILVPTRLEQQRQLEICAQCHSGPGIEAFGEPFTYRPGDPIQAHYRLKAFDEQNRIGVHATNQLARLSRSACFRESPDMTCVTCHDPHRLERGQKAVFSERCQKCHDPHVCGMQSELGAAIEENCIDCHLPTKYDLGMSIETATGFEFPQMRDHFVTVYPEISEKIAAEMGR